MRTGQTALEFMVLLGFMLIVFTSFFYVVKERSEVSTQQARYVELITVSEIVQEEVTIANRVKDGYRRVFDLPKTIGGAPYTILLDGRSEITVRTIDREYFVFLPTNITAMPGNLPSAPLVTGKNVIQKRNGSVSITPITASMSITPNPCQLSGAPSCAMSIMWGGTGEGTHLLITTQTTGAESVWQCTQQVSPPSSPQNYAISQTTQFRLYTATGCALTNQIMLADTTVASVIP